MLFRRKEASRDTSQREPRYPLPAALLFPNQLNGLMRKAVTIAAVAALTAAVSTADAQLVAVDHIPQRHAVADSIDDARAFVQQFYNWYLTTAPGYSPSPAYWRVLNEQPSSLTNELQQLLQTDSLARSSAEPRREVLNFDPFLASQDPCSSYQAIAAEKVDSVYVVTVRPVCAVSGLQTTQPRVQVVPQSGSWRIADVYYESDNLRALLQQYSGHD